MPSTDHSNYADRVMHIIRTYGDLPLAPGVLKSFRCDALEAHGHEHARLPEDEAALFLTRCLHAMVVSELRSAKSSASADRALGAWSRFVQQAMYRADLGLINLVLFNHEILPRIDEVERIARDHLSAKLSPQKESASRKSGVQV